jgi:hypothetical protein
LQVLLFRLRPWQSRLLRRTGTAEERSRSAFESPPLTNCGAPCGIRTHDPRMGISPRPAIGTPAFGGNRRSPSLPRPGYGFRPPPPSPESCRPPLPRLSEAAPCLFRRLKISTTPGVRIRLAPPTRPSLAPRPACDRERDGSQTSTARASDSKTNASPECSQVKERPLRPRRGAAGSPDGAFCSGGTFVCRNCYFRRQRQRCFSAISTQ